MARVSFFTEPLIASENKFLEDQARAISGAVVQVTSLIILLVAIPIVFCMLTWVAATAYRLYFPDKPLPLEKELTFISRMEPATADLPLPVGVREIKEDQRRWQRSRSSCSYCFAHGISNGLPSGWLEDMWRRRN